MAPEQGLSKTSDCGKPSPANGSTGSSNSLHPNDTPHPSNSLNWIYKTRKDQLLRACDKLNIEVTGQRVIELRKTISDHIKQQRLSKSTENLFCEIEKEIKDEEEDIIVSPTEPTQSFTNQISQPTDTSGEPNNKSTNQIFSTMIPPVDESKLISQVQSWNITYNGGHDLYSFLSKTEGRAESLNIHFDQLIPALPHLLVGSAQQWFDVQGRFVRNWEEFRQQVTQFFLPSRFLSQLENLYYNRRQRQKEKARDFILDLLTIARQHPDLKIKDHLDRLYDGLLPEYRLQIQRNSIGSIGELTTRCNEYEQLKFEENRMHRNDENRRTDNTTRHTNHMISPYQRDTHCWQCKRPGHMRKQCTNKEILFCSHCGKIGSLTRDCNCHTSSPALSAKINTPERIYIRICVKRFNFISLIDTGSSQSYLHPKMINCLVKAGFQLENSHNDIQVANQAIVRTRHCMNLPITVNNTTTWHTLTVVPRLAESIILGMDFLNKRGYKMFMDDIPIQPLPNQKTLTTTPHIAKLQAITGITKLKSEETKALTSFIEQEKTRFSTVTGPCKIATHTITLKHDTPIKQRYYPRNPAMQQIIDDEVNELLKSDRIEPSKQGTCA